MGEDNREYLVARVDELLALDTSLTDDSLRDFLDTRDAENLY